MMKSALAILASVVLACALPAEAAPLNVTFGAADATQRDAFNVLVTEFRSANPDVEVHLTLMELNAYRKSLPGTLDNEAAPDVFNWFAGDQMRNMALGGQLDDLSDLWKANTWWNTFTSTANAATVNGKQIALPYQYYPWGLFVRRDVLERAGVLAPPRDLGALMTACSKLTRAGFLPIALGAKDGWAVAAWFDYIDLRTNGAPFHASLTEGKVSYLDSNVRRTFLMWKQLIDAKCFAPNATTTDSAAAQSLLYQGRAGMMLMGTVASANFPESVRPLIDYARFPSIDAGQAPAEAAPTDTFHIAARARNKADARRFLRFAGSSAANAKLARSLGSFPTNKFAPVAGTVLDLNSYKVLTEAKGGLVQAYDRDTPAEMALQGVKGLQDFIAHPDQLAAILAQLDTARLAIYHTNASPEAVAAAPAKATKR